MRREMRLSVVCVVALCTAGMELAQGRADSGAPAQRTASASETLNGRDVAIRVFPNWEKDRWTYQLVVMRLEGNAFKFDLSESNISKDAVWVLIRADQTDEVVRDAVDWDAELLEQGGKVSLYPRRGSRPKCMRFIDGTGSPIAFGTGEVYKCGVKPEEDELKAKFVLDEQGKTQWRYTTTKSSKYYVRVRHPYYREWTYSIALNKTEDTWRIPMVKHGTLEYERSLRGMMVNDANEPVAGVPVLVERVYPLGGRVIYATGSATTDEYGYFHMYPLIWPESRENIGNLIPAQACYEVWIQPATELGLMAGTLCVPNDKEYTVNLSRGQFHTFAFEEGDEQVTDTDSISAFRLHVEQPNTKTLAYEYRRFKNGLVLPPGTYSISDWGSKYEFNPVKVTEDSPKEVLFRAKFRKSSDVVRYSGSVVDGVTREPIVGAFVVGTKNGRSPQMGPNFSEFSSEEWDKLRTLPRSFTVDAKIADRMAWRPDPRKNLGKPGDANDFPAVEDAILPVHKLWSVMKGVRTDSEGQFEIEFAKGEKLGRLLFFDEGYLCITLREYELTDGGSGGLKLGEVPLFPAAKVMVDAGVSGGRERIIPQWIIEPNNCPEWACPRERVRNVEIQSIEDSLAMEDSQQQDFGNETNRVRTLMEFDYGLWANFAYSQDISDGKTKVVHVPAGVKLRLEIQPLMDSKHEWVPYTYPQTILLEQGQTLDLGACEIRKSIYVYVKVVDEQGNAVEGIPVDNPIDGPPEKHPLDPSKGKHNTDGNGWVRFNVYPNMRGKFTITCEKHNLQEGVPFEVRGDEDTGREFVFQISEGLRKHFLN